MYKRDLITSELQKLSEMLARIMGLKKAGKEAAACEMTLNVISEQFGITPGMLETADNQWKDLLLEKHFSAEQTNMLAAFLYTYLNADMEVAIHKNISLKLELVYKMLEEEYNYISFTNIERRAIIQKYLQND